MRGGRWNVPLAIGGAAAIAFAVGRWTAPWPATPRPSTGASAAEPQADWHPPAFTMPQPGPNGASADELRAIVRAELRQLQAETAAAKPPPEAPFQETPQYATSVRVVDQAVAAGRWTTDDRSKLRQVLPSLGSAAMVKVIQRLVVAVNDGRLRVETNDGAPF